MHEHDLDWIKRESRCSRSLPREMRCADGIKPFVFGEKETEEADGFACESVVLDVSGYNESPAIRFIAFESASSIHIS